MANISWFTVSVKDNLRIREDVLFRLLIYYYKRFEGDIMGSNCRSSSSDYGRKWEGRKGTWAQRRNPSTPYIVASCKVHVNGSSIPSKLAYVWLHTFPSSLAGFTLHFL